MRYFWSFILKKLYLQRIHYLTITFPQICEENVWFSLVT